jgi:hypothetical protein
MSSVAELDRPVELDAVGHLKVLVDKAVKRLAVKRLGPNVTIDRAVTIVVANLGRHPGSYPPADAVLDGLIEGLARAAYREVEFRYLLTGLTDEERRAYEWDSR